MGDATLGNTSDSGGGGGDIDAGYFFGDGSFWVEGGAYSDLPDGAAVAPDAEIVDASPGCAPLAACCATLGGALGSLCDTIAGSGNASNCATELSQLQGESYCTGVAILATQIQVTPNRLVSDGTTLFWTTAASPGLFAMPVRGGPITTLLAGPVGEFLVVDDVNVYVMESAGPALLQTWNLVRIPKDGGQATLVNESGALVLAAATLGQTAYWLESMVPVGSGWDLPLALKSGALQGGDITTLAEWTPDQDNPPDAIAVTSSTVFLFQAHNPSWQEQFFPLSIGPAGGFMDIAGPTACYFVVADTDAVYCSQATGSNYLIGGGGTSVVLGPAVSSSYIVFDDTSVYWADMTAVGTIMKAPKTGGGSVTVLAQDTNPTAIAVDATSVYWSDQGGYIKSIAK
jgi:hypothetical protein